MSQRGATNGLISSRLAVNITRGTTAKDNLNATVAQVTFHTELRWAGGQMRASIIVATIFMMLSADLALAKCVTGSSSLGGSREFSLPRNSVCLINRGNSFVKIFSTKITVKPKLGQVGQASITEMAYRSGNKAGDDYFEYVNVQSIAGGRPREFRIRNTVHITP